MALRAATRLTTRIPPDAECQEASPESVKIYIPCRKPAVAVVDNGDRNPYFMCKECTDHNVHNRGAKVLIHKESQ